VTLEAEFAQGLLVRSRQRGYRLAQRPAVSFVADSTVERGEVAIEAGYGPSPPADAAEAAPPVVRPVVELSAEPSAEMEQPNEPLASGEPSAEAAHLEVPPEGQAAPQPGPRGGPAAEPPALYAYLHVASRGRPLARIPVGPAMIRIGRGPDNDLVVPDVRVSRQHGTVAVRHGLLVYTDLDSTNGSFVNGRRVAQIALGPADVLQIGDTTITVEPPA
jgi:hypothetical protein